MGTPRQVIEKLKSSDLFWRSFSNGATLALAQKAKPIPLRFRYVRIVTRMAVWERGFAHGIGYGNYLISDEGERKVAITKEHRIRLIKKYRTNFPAKKYNIAWHQLLCSFTFTRKHFEEKKKKKGEL